MKNKIAKLVLVISVLEIIASGIIFPTFGKFLLFSSAVLAFILPPLWAINTLVTEEDSQWRFERVRPTGGYQPKGSQVKHFTTRPVPPKSEGENDEK